MRKRGARIETETLCGVRIVPLLGRYGFHP
jgi:hypothetical protein